jgi:acetolactate synthase-1/2/3 large subunit
MSGTPTVAAALLDRLAAHGVGTAFGIPGVHNLPFWEAAGLDGRPRIIGTRHEQAAGYAADALARATGGIGVALTTTGPGFANALAAFGEAYAALSPVLLLSSEAPLRPRRTSGHDDGVLHGMRSQAAAVREGFGAAAVSVREPGEAVGALDTLVAGMRATGRPAYLGVPADLLGAPLPGPPSPITAGPSAPAPDPASVAAALDTIGGRRVVLWLGARAIDHEDAVAALAARLGARVVTTFGARGLLASYAGSITGPPHEPRVAAAIADADVLLVVGDELAGMTTRNWSMPVPRAIVAVTDDGGLSLGDYPLAARVVGDVGACVTALLDGLGPAGDGPVAPPADDLTPAVLVETRGDPRTADGLALVDAVASSWPDDGVVIADMCVAGYWLAGYSRQPRPRRLAYPVGWGTLGFALPAAIGPASTGRPTLVVTGDGGATMAIGELATLEQERLPAVVLVVTDGGYGMLRYDQTVAGAEHRGVDLVEPRWADLAAAYSFAHLESGSVGSLAAALSTAYADLAHDRRTLVVLRAALRPPRTTSPRWNEAPHA